MAFKCIIAHKKIALNGHAITDECTLHFLISKLHSVLAFESLNYILCYLYNTLGTKGLWCVVYCCLAAFWFQSSLYCDLRAIKPT